MTTSEHEAAATGGALVRGSTDVAGVRLAWTRSGPPGAGPTVVLAHGLTDDAACWGTTARRLALEHDVLAYDARGHGDSDRADDYTAEAGTADLLGLSNATALRRWGSAWPGPRGPRERSFTGHLSHPRGLGSRRLHQWDHL
ncbi:MAG: alpha/beta fold hydrolase [Quadrisphaera sp.]